MRTRSENAPASKAPHASPAVATMTVNGRAALLQDAANAELARRDLLTFSRHVNSKFEAPLHIRFLAEKLEALERGTIQRLAISCPPGHGKSTLLNSYIAFTVGRDPARRVLAISASEALAKRNSREAQGHVTSDTWPFAVSLSTESVLEWNLKPGSGSVRAIGKLGQISGFRAERIVVDDLQADAGSDLTRKSDFEWFQAVLSTRLEPDGSVCVIQTRWHDDDIIGALQQSEAADEWVFVNLPAIAEDGDPLGREPGEALWPERWPTSRLEIKKREVGASVFGSLYQGDPVPAGGAIFKAEWFEHRFDMLPSERAVEAPVEAFAKSVLDAITTPAHLRATKPAAMRPIVLQACDSAWKSGPSHDRSVIATLVSDFKDIYIADLWYGRVEYPELRRIVQRQYAKHRPSRLYVEEASSGFAVVADLRQYTDVPIIGIPPGREAKQARAESVAGLFESGRVKFPRNAAWMADLLSEFLRFPYGRHDDIVDAVVLGIRQMEILIRQVLAQEQITQRRSAIMSRPWMIR